MTLGSINPEFGIFTISSEDAKKFKNFWLLVFLDILGGSLAKKMDFQCPRVPRMSLPQN